MFNFFSMLDNYEDRKVDNFQKGGLTVDTCRVTDGSHPFETGIEHPEYNDGQWVIVEAYDTQEDAQCGHDKWVKIMTSKKLPDQLVDCNNSGIQQLGTVLGSKNVFPRQK